MSDHYKPGDYVDAIIRDFPKHEKGTRPVHVNGIIATGRFRASEAAAAYCTAEHFQGEDIDVTVRFSNGSGNAPRHDYWNDVRGMATRFHLKNDMAADLIAMTLAEFFAPDPDTFMRFTLDSVPDHAKTESPWRKLLDMLRLELPLPDPMPGQEFDSGMRALAYANRHAYARAAVADSSSIGAPACYARAAYHACNAFIAVAPDGHRRYVRFSWQPVAGVRKRRPSQTSDDYLNGELKKRVNRWPARFILNMVIGEDGDAMGDPTKPWPRRRKKISMGTLYLSHVPEDQEEFCKQISFNPGRLPPGLEMAPEDEILALRLKVYENSRERRGGTPCPFFGGETDE